MTQRRTNTDGRLARSERTRTAIIAAHQSFLQEGVFRPTAALISERAGISVRTLWINFRDMDGLLLATVESWLAADDQLRAPIEVGGSLEHRIECFCKERVRRLEAIAPVARAAELFERRTSTAIKDKREQLIEGVRADLEKIFAAELIKAPAPDVLLDTLTVTTSWAAWSLLRDDLELSEERSHTAMTKAIHSLLQ